MVKHFTGIVFGLLALAALNNARADGLTLTPGYYRYTCWGLVEGERGLDRPGYAAPTTTYGYVRCPPQRVRVSPYFPTTGQPPAAGRLEIEPPANRELPPPAESFHRFWSTSSGAAVPADLPPPESGAVGEAAPTNLPIIVAPQIGPRRHHP